MWTDTATGQKFAVDTRTGNSYPVNSRIERTSDEVAHGKRVCRIPCGEAGPGGSMPHWIKQALEVRRRIALWDSWWLMQCNRRQTHHTPQWSPGSPPCRCRRRSPRMRCIGRRRRSRGTRCGEEADGGITIVWPIRPKQTCRRAVQADLTRTIL